MSSKNLNKEIEKEYTTTEFISLYMNDHNGNIPRWLRGIFMSEEEKIATILEYMEAMEAKLSSLHSTWVKEQREKIEEYKTKIAKAEIYSSNPELSHKTADDIINLLNSKE